MVVRVRAREDLHGRNAAFDKRHLIGRLERLGNVPTFDAGHEARAAEDVLPLGGRAGAEDRDRLRAEAADGVEVDHAPDVVERERRWMLAGAGASQGPGLLAPLAKILFGNPAQLALPLGGLPIAARPIITPSRNAW